MRTDLLLKNGITETKKKSESDHIAELQQIIEEQNEALMELAELIAEVVE